MTVTSCEFFFFNQKRRSSSFFESASIKEEPFSPRDVDINVVDDDDDDDDDTISDDKLTTFLSANGTKVRNRTSACIVKKQNTLVVSTTATATVNNNNNNSKAEAAKLPQLRQTVRLTRVRIAFKLKINFRKIHEFDRKKGKMYIEKKELHFTINLLLMNKFCLFFASLVQRRV